MFYMRWQGFSLLELMVAIMVLAILLTVGIPSYVQFREDNTLSSAGRDLYGGVLLARSESTKRHNEDVKVLFFGGSSWCYRITDLDAATCDSCSATCDIDGDGQTRGGDAASYSGVQMSNIGYPDDALLMGSLRGTMLDGSILLSLGSKEIKVTTNKLGRVYLCTPPGTYLTGVDACS
ncbi:prepilin-type N-terminal cleavage/methylation domain-containing protein [Pseudaeromonas sp. ZJS20]|uniref:Tfp pilus assembly protein FimT/FimU n=1 Tax=Pseudaeromonas aegiceratis TaxID=3153928 RepID=UPI00390C5695